MTDNPYNMEVDCVYTVSLEDVFSWNPGTDTFLITDITGRDITYLVLHSKGRTYSNRKRNGNTNDRRFEHAIKIDNLEQFKQENPEYFL